MIQYALYWIIEFINIFIGHRVVLATIDLDINPDDRSNHYSPIRICDNVWIGAGAVVTKDVPPFTVVGGVYDPQYKQSLVYFRS